MKQEHFEEMVRRSFHVAAVEPSGDWQHDVAVKLYFFPLCSFLFTDEEWADFIQVN